MAICKRCGIEFEAMFDLKPVFCDACIEGFFDEDDDGIPCADDIGLPRVEWMTDDPD